MTLIAPHESMRRVADLFVRESAAVGRKLERGQRLGVLRQIYFGKDPGEVRKLADQGHAGSPSASSGATSASAKPSACPATTSDGRRLRNCPRANGRWGGCSRATTS